MIKSRERTKYIPIIFLTAISKDEEYVFEGYSVGAVDYMSKPFQPDILRSKVSVFVELYQQAAAARRAGAAAARERAARARAASTCARCYESEARFSRDRRARRWTRSSCSTPTARSRCSTRAAERMFGTPAAEAVGSDVEPVLPRADARACSTHLPVVATTASGAGREPTDAHVLSFTGVRANGEEFPIEASVELPRRARQAHATRSSCATSRSACAPRRRSSAQAESLAQAMAELKALNEELHERQAELERAMAARSRFYASMSHELRTPINAVLGYSTLLLENIYGPLNEKQAEGITRTHKAAKHLLELVNDVLDLSKIEAGKIDLRLQPVTFPALIEDLFVTVRPLADQYGSALALEHDGRADQGRQRSAARAADPAQPALERDQVRHAASRSSVASHADRGRRRRDRGDRSGRRDRAARIRSGSSTSSCSSERRSSRMERASACRSRAGSPRCCTASLDGGVGGRARGARSGCDCPTVRSGPALRAAAGRSRRDVEHAVR